MNSAPSDLGRLAKERHSSIDVLVVEDDESTRRGLELTLGHEGYAVYSAASLREATALLQTFIFDAMIVDLNLPDGMGDELLSDSKLGVSVPRKLLVTGASNASLEAVSKCRRFDACLFKPINIQLLLRELRRAP